jgi:hypothetical protein
VDISHLQEAHLHHLEEKTDVTNKLFGDMLEANVWFMAKLTDAIVKNKWFTITKTWSNHLAQGPLPHDVPQPQTHNCEEMQPSVLHQLHLGPFSGGSLAPT